MTSSPTSQRILAVDDSPATLELLQRNLLALGHTVLTARCVDDALRILKETSVDLVITDLKMPRVSGLELVRHIHENFHQTAIIMVTGYASIDTAVSAVQAGADDYLSKPFTDEELAAAVNKAIEKLRLRRAGNASGRPPATNNTGLLAESAAMQRVLQAIPKAASAAATVLITGESGTGKELVARAVHYSSDRAAAPFVPVNCAGIPEGLVESEVFGHLKGAFTGATTTRAGFFITADGGTIFLDEVSELSQSVQGKLLRVLQEGEVQMVGAQTPRKVDVRVIAATNKALPALIRGGAFREDLFFRLNVLPIDVPPLRERGDDVLLLLRHFCNKYAAAAGKPLPRFTDRALEAVRAYHWPGNVRELENLVQRLIVMSDASEIDISDLPPHMRFSVSPSGGRRTLVEVEAEHIRTVLADVRGNKTHAAKILGIDRKTLREKCKQLEIADQSDAAETP